MDIRIAGFNIDKEIIDDAKKTLKCELTPETISAAYARISRSPDPIWKLRKIAREEVEKARKSNEKIVFGLGHSSIAEHAVFNIDFINISRLAVEFLEHFRLASFTEKSQRYVTFSKGYIIPEEFLKHPLKDKYIEIMDYLFNGYRNFFEQITEKYIFEGMSKKEAELKAKEDSRYLLPLSTYTQLGATFNARSIEKVIQKSLTNPIYEIKEIGNILCEKVSKIAPSLIKYTEPEKYHQLTEKELEESLNGYKSESTEDFKFIFKERDIDEKILILIIYKNSCTSFEKAKKIAKDMNDTERKKIFYTIFKNLKSYNSLLREFEGINFEFETVVSSSCFAQLKRHRMSTIIPSRYDTELGVTVPPVFERFGLKEDFLKIIEKVNKFYSKISKRNEKYLEYILTNSHRRRVYVKMNLRELYHFIRLRSDIHAQWDIRNLSEKIKNEVMKSSNFATLLLCGKDSFEKLKEEVLKKLK